MQRMVMIKSFSPCISLSSDSDFWENDIEVQRFLQDSFDKQDKAKAPHQ